MTEDKLLLIGCGILKKEISFLIKKNRWPVDTLFLDSALHVDFDKLSKSLTTVLSKYQEQEVIVFYGCCHPLMEKMLEEAKTFRTTGQNCVDMLLGNALFTQELSEGAFFLLEDWAQRWDYIITKTFGKNRQIIQAIFQEGGREYLLCLKTPCSGDFKAEAEEASRKVGLPLRWMDVSLDHLESVLQTAITRKIRELSSAKVHRQQ